MRLERIHSERISMKILSNCGFFGIFVWPSELPIYEVATLNGHNILRSPSDDPIV